MTFPTLTIRAPRIREAVLAALACLLVLALPAAPAHAHDKLKSSSPAKDAEVSSVEEIELEFTASVKFPFVVLHDEAGGQVTLGEPETDGPKVSAAVPEPLAPGSYVIAWRVVSSDGHPIEGEIPFTVKGEAASSAPASPDPAASAPASDAPATASAQDDAASTAASSETESSGVPVWIWVALAVLVVLGAVVGLRAARRRPEGEEPGAQ
ncbi:copper resistance protein CopC [Nonomuraea mesophila]|uniref:Copper resistance protein CopC n=1 Tax=Nonomuraea mesophila TaxID=2530382 RepID=A0A4R5EFF4_9ACTN|nr:copper resistance protein CopC [Nonomuraea mesophila]TDE33050.1 copper resistance protein CopC [Nonomuraea mesophila]